MVEDARNFETIIDLAYTVVDCISLLVPSPLVEIAHLVRIDLRGLELDMNW